MQRTFTDGQLLTGLVVVALLAVVGGQARLLRLQRALGVEQLLASGFLFLPLGMLLSEAGLGLINGAVVREYDALVTLGLGVLGLLLGLRQELRLDTPQQRALARGALVESVFTLLLVAAPLYLLLEIAGTSTRGTRAAAAALLGCAASISAAKSLQVAWRRGATDAPDTLTKIADWGNVAGVLAAGVLLSLLAPNRELGGLERLLALAAIGAVGGLAAWLFASETHEPGLRMALLVGLLLVTAGTATHLGLPPVAATLLAGVAITQLSPALARELRTTLAFLEPPLTVLLLVIAGAALRVPTFAALAVTSVFLVLRTAGKILGGVVAARAAGHALPERMGLGLLPSGAVALGLALDYQLFASGPIADVVITATVLGSALSETAGVWTTRLLARSSALEGGPGELTPAPGTSPLSTPPTGVPRSEPPAVDVLAVEPGARREELP